MAADIDVIVLNEHEFLAELGIAHHLRDLLQHALAGFVQRMRFTCKYELNRAVGIIHHRCQLLDIAENEIRTLVGCKPSREANRQRVPAKHAVQTLQYLAGLAAPLGLRDRAFAYELDQLRLEIEVGLPKLAVIHAFDAKPDLRLAAALDPVSAQMAIVEAEHLRSEPRGNMHAVSDMSDGNLVLGLSAEQAGPHGSRNFAVQRGHRIGAARKPQGKHGHAKQFVGVAGMFAAEPKQTFLGKTQRLAQRSNMFLDQPGVESVVPGRNWRVGGENHFARNPRYRSIEGDAFILHPHANGFQNRKSTVALVQMKHARSNSQGFQGAQAPNTQQKFLANADAQISAVQAGRQLTIFGRVALHVRIQQQQVAATDFHAPHFGKNASTPGFNLDHHRPAIFANGDLHRKLIDVGLEVLFPLPSPQVEMLAEVPLPVKQPDSDQGNVKIRRAFDVIAGENSQAAGVHRQGFMKSELCREIRHWMRPQHAGVPGSPGTVVFQILQHAPIRVVHAAVKHQFGRSSFQLRQGNFAQQSHRIMVQVTPPRRIQVQKKALRVMVPTPPQIARQRPQALLQWRNEAIQGARFAHHWRDLHRSLAQHAYFFCTEHASFHSLDDKDTLQNAAIHQRNAQKRLISVLAGVAEIFETGVILHVTDGNRLHLFRHESGQSLMHSHSQIAYAFATQPNSGRQHEIGAVWFQQICRTDVRMKSFGNQSDDVHQRFR